MPGKGRVAEPGLAAIAPGRGVIMIMPVSVCHQVSTMGQRLWPRTSRYHIQASGLIGSPTVPSDRRLSSLCFLGHSSPHLMNVRMAVGAVYKVFTWWRSIMLQKRSGSGKLGAPSYINVV